MRRRFAPLTQRQADVMAWVGDGCPEGVWSDSTYKVTTYALADRGLVSVDRRRHGWAATLTDGGRYNLAHGSYCPDQDADSRRRLVVRATSRQAEQSVAARFLISPAELVAELQASHGAITVKDPPPHVRAGYRSAISQATTTRCVPNGYTLRYTGRDHGDLVIRLASPEPATPPQEQLAPIDVPEALDAPHPAVQQLRNQPTLLDVSDESRERALLIAQAIATECQRRSYSFKVRDDNKATFQINIDGDTFRFSLSEEHERRTMPDPDALAQAKYPWQRIRSTTRETRSGRLVLRLAEGAPTKDLDGVVLLSARSGLAHVRSCRRCRGVGELSLCRD